MNIALKSKPVPNHPALLTVLFVGVSLMTPGWLAAEDTTYQFGVSDQRTTITFQSETDFEIILGSSTKMSGSASGDWEAGTASLEIEVPVSSLRTGIEMRDDHLRSAGWLDEKKFPSIIFASKNIRKGSGNAWSADGDFTMHGVTRKMSIAGDVRRIPAEMAKKAGLEKGDWIRLTSSFEVKLSDFGVKIPERAAAKVNDTWIITVQAFAASSGK